MNKRKISSKIINVVIGALNFLDKLVLLKFEKMFGKISSLEFLKDQLTR